MKGLLVQASNDSIVAAQCEPFLTERSSLRRELNFDFEHIRCSSFSEVPDLLATRAADVVFLLPLWNENPNEVERVLVELRRSAPSCKLIFVDPFAQTSSRFFNVLPAVDRFLKRQRLKNLDDYSTSFAGGTVFTDFLVRHCGYSLDDWSVESDVPQGFVDRIETGWNLGTSDRFRKVLLARRSWFSRPPKKEVDIFCRLSVGSSQKQEWYSQYRIEAVESLKPLETEYRLIALAGFSDKGDLVSKRQYFSELQRSRLVFSPFGWGESCWRDFEAVCFDCLLVKPSMSHIDTSPNLYVEGETYVPVAWDFSDLEEKCRYYLSHPDEAEKIVQKARQVYTQYFKTGGFAQDISRITR